MPRTQLEQRTPVPTPFRCALRTLHPCDKRACLRSAKVLSTRPSSSRPVALCIHIGRATLCQPEQRCRPGRSSVLRRATHQLNARAILAPRDQSLSSSRSTSDCIWSVFLLSDCRKRANHLPLPSWRLMKALTPLRVGLRQSGKLAIFIFFRATRIL